MHIDRATYSLAASEDAAKLDVFATAFPTMQGRLPGGSIPARATPLLAAYPAECAVTSSGALAPPAGIKSVQMGGSGSDYYAQAQVATVPAGVCVEDRSARDVAGKIVPTFSQAAATDQVTVTQADFDPDNGGKLTIRATSTDARGVTLTYAGEALDSGQLVIAPLAAPPSKVRVFSNANGVGELPVKTGVASSSGGGKVPVASNDAFTVAEDAGATSLAILTNDAVNGGAVPSDAIVTIVGAPGLGTAVANADGTVTYTPKPNANGTDGFSYTVTVDGMVSAVASVAIALTDVNDAPVAVNDTIAGVANQPLTIRPLTNDSDVDGATDLANVVIGAVTPAVMVAPTVVDGAVTFTAPAAGTYRFTYQAVDRQGLQSNTATVTVNVSGSENINATATFRTDQGRWIVTGTDSVPSGQTLVVTLENGTKAGTVLGRPQVDPTGAFNLDFRGATGALDPRTSGATLVRIIAPGGATSTAPIVVRR